MSQCVIRPQTVKSSRASISSGRAAQEGAFPEVLTSGASADTDKPQGKLMIDATVTDEMIVYPTDLNLLNESREQSERLIDLLYEQGDWQAKPRTYRRNARTQYLQIVKKKRKSKKVLHKAIGQQLRYLRRNLKTINGMLDTFRRNIFPFSASGPTILLGHSAYLQAAGGDVA